METKTSTQSGLTILFVIAPVVTVYALTLMGRHTELLGAAPLSVWLVAALVLWSPLPISIPAVLLEADRDAALPGYRGFGRVVRAVRLIPHMVLKSDARVAFTASLLGFGGALVIALPFF